MTIPCDLSVILISKCQLNELSFVSTSTNGAKGDTHNSGCRYCLGPVRNAENFKQKKKISTSNSVWCVPRHTGLTTLRMAREKEEKNRWKVSGKRALENVRRVKILCLKLFHVGFLCARKKILTKNTLLCFHFSSDVVLAFGSCPPKQNSGTREEKERMEGKILFGRSNNRHDFLAPRCRSFNNPSANIDDGTSFSLHRTFNIQRSFENSVVLHITFFQSSCQCFRFRKSRVKNLKSVEESDESFWNIRHSRIFRAAEKFKLNCKKLAKLDIGIKIHLKYPEKKGTIIPNNQLRPAYVGDKC